MVDFSIIIPVYNSENTLNRCLESIKSQTHNNYEVILIDDGSTDSSLQICKKYESNDNRYFVIHQSNSGPSAARNAGLDKANGKWICFIDSDDFVEPTYLQELFTTTNSSEIDVVFFGYNKIQNDNKKEAILPCDIAEDNLKTYINLSEIDMFGYTWIKIFKKDIIKDIRFDSHLNLFEDEVFACQVVKNCSDVAIINKPIYNYNIGDGSSLIGRTHIDYCLKCDKVYFAWKDLLNEYRYKKNILDKKANFFVSRCYYYYFERNVPIKDFFIKLSNTSFFQEHTQIFSLDYYVKKNKYFKLYLKKINYNIKIILYNLTKEVLLWIK